MFHPVQTENRKPLTPLNLEDAKKMRRFGTQGRVYPEDHYVVPRTAEVADFINRVKEGRYIVLFAPRQTGKTTFFQLALAELTAKDTTYFPIQLNFEVYEDCTSSEFYESLTNDIHEKIIDVFQEREQALPKALTDLLETTHLTNQLSQRQFLKTLGKVLEDQRIVLIIDEFDAIPRDAVKGFLRVLREIYLSGRTRCPHSVGIVGVKDITQLDYDRSISPFNIQDEFRLPPFTLEQVRELLAQYTDEVGQAFAPEVIENIHRQTAGQPFLANRFRDFIARAGFRILLVPNTPKEFIGQHFLYVYLDQFVQLVHGHIYLEGQTGRGKIDLAIFHNAEKYIVETKIWEGPRSYQAGKRQLAAYLQLEGAVEGYYVVFDHREHPEPRAETETVDGMKIRSYVIPVMQKRPSQAF